MERSQGFMSSAMSLASASKDVVHGDLCWRAKKGLTRIDTDDTDLKTMIGVGMFRSAVRLSLRSLLLIVFVFRSVSSVSIRVKYLLQQVVADEFEGVLAGPPANAFAVAGEVELFYVRVVGVGEGDVDETDRLIGVWAWSSGAW